MSFNGIGKIFAFCILFATSACERQQLGPETNIANQAIKLFRSAMRCPIPIFTVDGRTERYKLAFYGSPIDFGLTEAVRAFEADRAETVNIANYSAKWSDLKVQSINPVSSGSPVFRLFVSCREATSCFKTVRQFDAFPEEIEPDSSLFIYACDHDTADNLSVAIKALARINGGVSLH